MTDDQIRGLMQRLTSRAESLPHGSPSYQLFIDAAVVIGHQRETLLEVDYKIAKLERRLAEVLE